MCCLLAAFTILTIVLYNSKSDEQRFHDITSRLFKSEIKSNTLNMHYTIAYPENFGITDYQPTLSCYDKNKTMLEQVSCENILQSLYALNPENLDAEDKYTYTLLTRSLENSLALNSYRYYDEPLSPSSGAQSQLPILLAEYTFRSKRDVEDYLSILSQTGEYFDSLLTYEQEKADAGFLMSCVSIKKVEEQCDSIITTSALDSSSHFLQTTFCERLDKLVSEGLITSQEKLSYIEKNDTLLKTVLLPAYTSLSDGLYLLEDKASTLSGLASLPDGQEYYRLYLTSQTGSYRDISEIKQILLSTFTNEWNAIQDTAKAYPAAAILYTENESGSFPYDSADEMLTDLQQRMTNDFPAIPSKKQENETQSEANNSINPTENTDNYGLEIKSVSSCMEDYCAPAFYLTAPIDDTDENVIYINEKNSPDSLELYTTLAHEGFPGHLYQTVYNNIYSINNGTDNVRQLLWYGGYLEGWALYVEFIAYDYASDIYSGMEDRDMSVMVQLEKHNRSLTLCLYSILDLMINYENASYEQVAEVLAGLGINSSASVSAVYSYISEEPCNYMKYYLGYLEILKLKAQAQDLWREDYTDMAFHKFFLESGPSDFTSLNEKLENMGSLYMFY
jgi:uncharacterized protein (DUF885 family)